MTVADDLRILVDEDYPEMVANLNIILDKLDESHTEIVNEIITINDGVLDAAEAAHFAALEAKRVANSWLYTETYGNYGTLNLTEWQIWEENGNIITTPQLAYLGPDTFSCTPGVNFAAGLPILVQPGNIVRVVLSTVWFPNPPPGPPPPVSTTVNLVPGGPALPGGLTSVEKSSVIYSPTVNWDSDPTIEPHQGAFATGYNQLTQEPGVNGTYGLIPKRDQIELGQDIQTINRDAYQSFIDDYEPYAA